MSHRNWGVPVKPAVPEPLLGVIWRNRRPVALGAALYGAACVLTAIYCVPVFRLAAFALVTVWMLCGGK